MRQHDLHQLPQVHIPEPCSANWDEMTGDHSRRFCTKCNLHVQNISETPSELAEQILTQGKTCIRAVGDSQRGIRTKDGWLPKLLVAGAMAASMSGCAIMGSRAEDHEVPEVSTPVTGAVAVQPPVMGEMMVPRSNETIGKVKVTTPPKKTKSPKPSDPS